MAKISQNPVPAYQKNLIFEITVEDQDEEDVEVPFVKVRIVRN